MKLSHLKIIPQGIFKGISSRVHRALYRGQYPTFLLLSVTDRCNCRCAMCHIWQKKNPPEISLEDYRKIFMDPLWKNIRILSLTGGEPFLRQDLLEIIALAAECFPKLERVSMPTNGLLTRQIVKGVKGMLEILSEKVQLKIGISIDGPKEIHDFLRGVPGVFDKAISSLQELQKITNPNFEVGILSLITKENTPFLEQIHTLLTSYTDTITWTLSTDAAFFDNEEESCVVCSCNSEEVMLNFIDKILVPNYPEKAYLYSKYRDHILKEKRTYPCLAGYLSAYMDTSGNLMPCHYLSTDYSFINFFSQQDQSLASAWFSPEARQIRKKMSKEPYCLNCSNNCDSRNIVKEDFWNFFAYLLTHPAIPLRILLNRKSGTSTHKEKAHE